MRRLGLLVGAIGIVAGGTARGGALDGIARRLAEQVRVEAGNAWAGSDLGVVWHGEARLIGDLGPLLLSRLSELGARSTERRESGDRAAAREDGVDLLLDLTVAVAANGLRVDGALDEVRASPWRAEPLARSHLHVMAPLDPELAVYLPLPPPVAATPLRWPEGPVGDPGRRGFAARRFPIGDLALLALDVGDVDGDGKSEVVGATADEVVIFAFDVAAQRFVERRRVSIAGRPAPQRPRDDVAGIAIVDGAIRVHTSRHADGVKLVVDGAGERSEPLGGFPVPGTAAVCALEPGANWLRGGACLPPLPLPARVWAVAGLHGDGVLAAVEPDGNLAILRPGSPPVQVRGAGACVAVARLDRRLVVATSEPGRVGAADAVTVRDAAVGAAVLYRLDHLVGAVVALAAGDADRDGVEELVAAVRDRAASRSELILIR